MRNFKNICLELDDFFEKNKDDISVNQYQSYLGLKEAIGTKFNELSSDEIKFFTSLCIEKSGDRIDIYDYSTAIATAIYIDDVITLDELENSKLRENQPKNSQEELNAPILPQLEEDDNDYDLQKELEAKFDELFGPITDDDE